MYLGLGSGFGADHSRLDVIKLSSLSEAQNTKGACTQ